MSQSVVEQIAHLKQAILAQEGLREAWGDDVADTAVQILHKELAALQAHTAVEQRKQVTVLFADLVGFVNMSEALDPEDVRDILNAYFQRWATVIAEYGGLVEKFIGDAVMAIFGALNASENDPENAVRAALAMQRELAVLNERFSRDYGVELAMRVGVSTGPVLMSFLGQAAVSALEMGGEQASDAFTVVGDTVNLASRLERAAPIGGVLISHDSYRHVRGVFDARQLEPIQVKGKKRPTLVYLILAVKPRAFRLTGRGIEGLETAMIGRDREMNRIKEAFHHVVGHRSTQSLTIVGDTGVGKSRLLYEFRAWLQVRPEIFRIFKGRGRQETRHLPFALIRDMVAFRFQIQDSDSPATARRKLVDGAVGYMGEEGAEKAPFIGHLVGFDFASSPHLKAVLADPRQLRERGFAYMGELLAAVASSDQVAFYLDDLHWADDSSLELIDYLMTQCRHLPILYICLTRPAFFERQPRWGADCGCHYFLNLRPLDIDNSRALVEELLRPARVLPDDLRETIVNAAEGNPFYMEELVKMLIEDGVIVKGEAYWEVQTDRLAHLRVPATLTGVLQARLDSLLPVERETLQIAAVMGRAFWEEGVVTLRSHGLPAAERARARQETLNILNRLQLKELIFRQEESGFDAPNEFVFKQTFLRDVTYNSLLRRQRRIYHAQIANWLIEKVDGRLMELAGLIGEHFEWAEELETAVDWYICAGEQAQAAYAPDTAVAHYQRALLHLHALPAQPELLAKRITVQNGLGEMFRLQTRFAEAAQAFTAMQELAAATDDFLSLTRAWLGLAHIRAAQGEYREALSSVERAEAAAAQAAELADAEENETAVLEMVRAHNSKSMIYYRLSEFDRAANWSEQALTLGRQINARLEMARSLNLLGHVEHMRGCYQGVDAYYQQSLQLYQEVNDPLGIVAITTNLGEIARLRADYSQAQDFFMRAIKLAQEVHDRDGEMLARHNLAAVSVGMGNYAQAEAALRRLIPTAAAVGWSGLSESYRFLAEACLGQDDLDGALNAAQEALILAHEVEELEMIGAAWRVLARLSAAFGGAITLDTTLTDLPDEALDARRCFARSLHIFREIGVELEQAHTLRSWAEYELTAVGGNRTLGQRYWQQALAIFTRLGIDREIGRMELAVSN